MNVNCVRFSFDCPFQGALLQIDKSLSWANDKYIIANYTFYNAADGHSILYNQDVYYLVEIKRKQQVMTVYLPVDNNDREFTKILFSTTVDSCKQFAGIASNPIMKAFMENFSAKGFSCPFKTNHNYQIVNMTCSDNLLPPSHFEVKFKLEGEHQGLIEGKRGWKKLYGYKFYGRYKKWILLELWYFWGSKTLMGFCLGGGLQSTNILNKISSGFGFLTNIKNSAFY